MKMMAGKVLRLDEVCTLSLPKHRGSQPVHCMARKHDRFAVLGRGRAEEKPRIYINGGPRGLLGPH